MATMSWAVQCGRNVSDRRIAIGFTQKQAADLAGITQAAWSATERGGYVPRDHVKVAIALALATEVDLLWPYPKRVRIEEMREAAALAAKRGVA